MSKSLKRVIATADAAGLPIDPIEMTTPTNTAQQAADAVGVEVDQILKSIIFAGETSGLAVLFMTAGTNRVAPEKASELAGEPLGKADAAFIRAETGFAIGGVAPIGHTKPVKAYFDPRLLEFPVIWAAAGTPRHNFAVDPNRIVEITGAKIADFTL